MTSVRKTSPARSILAMGIDYTTTRNDDPLGRGFEYVPFAKDGTYRPIGELF